MGIRKEQSEHLAMPVPGTMRKPRFSHKRSAAKGITKLNVAFAPLKKL